MICFPRSFEPKVCCDFRRRIHENNLKLEKSIVNLGDAYLKFDVNTAKTRGQPQSTEWVLPQHWHHGLLRPRRFVCRSSGNWCEMGAAALGSTSHHVHADGNLLPCNPPMLSALSVCFPALSPSLLLLGSQISVAVKPGYCFNLLCLTSMTF